LISVLFLTLAVVVPDAATAQGSTGGTLGKTDQSLSGGQQGKAGRATASPAAGSEGTTVLGRWKWTQECQLSGTWKGEFHLKGSSRQITGSISYDPRGGPAASPDAIVGGHVSGSAVVLTRRFTIPFGTYVQTWTGTLSGTGKAARMAGEAVHSMESCSFTAGR
jgi:hypothetical protein